MCSGRGCAAGLCLRTYNYYYFTVVVSSLQVISLFTFSSLFSSIFCYILTDFFPVFVGVFLHCVIVLRSLLVFKRCSRCLLMAFCPLDIRYVVETQRSKQQSIETVNADRTSLSTSINSFNTLLSTPFPLSS